MNVQNATAATAVFNNIFLHEDPSRGSICIAPDCLIDWRSNHNVVTERFTFDRGTSILRRSKWTALTQGDGDSLVATARELFADSRDHDDQLRGHCVAIAAGTPYRTPAADLEGTVRPASQPDIGALQHKTEVAGQLSNRPDRDRPQLIHGSPSGSLLPPWDHLHLEFSEELRPESLNDKTLVLRGPGGPITPLEIKHVQGPLYRVEFPAQSILGAYALTLTRGIEDPAGNPLKQTSNRAAPIDESSHFFVGFQLVDSYRFCFGTPTSPTVENCARITEITGYTSHRGYGGLNGGVRSVDTETGPDLLLRSLDYGPKLHFAVDLPPGEYDVTLTLGNMKFAHDQIAVFLQDQRRDVVNTATGKFHTRSYHVTAPDRRLDVLLRDLGGSDPNAVLNSLVVTQTSLASRLVGETGLVLAIEPLQENLACLIDACARNQSTNVVCLGVALNDANGLVTLHGAGDGQVGLTSLRPIGSRMSRALGCRFESVIDEELFATVRLIKLDVEGAEMKVVRGMEPLLRRGHYPFIICEVTKDFLRWSGDSAEEIALLMSGLGFQLFATHRQGNESWTPLVLSDIPTEQFDMLCIPPGVDAGAFVVALAAGGAE